MSDGTGYERLAEGAAAGFVGTAGLMAARIASQKWLPDAQPPMRQEPGEFMVEQAAKLLPDETRTQIPDAAKKAGSQALGLGYGLTFGAIYAALRPKGGSTLLDGAALGLGVWAAGYL